MNKFDVTKFLFEGLLKEQGEDEEESQENQEQPQQAQVQQQKVGQEEPTPAQAQKIVKPVSTPFDQFTGATIKDMQFKPHENGGSIVIKTSVSPLPLIISWVGDRVTVKHTGVTSLT
jgi:hypothetical protein